MVAFVVGGEAVEDTAGSIIAEAAGADSVTSRDAEEVANPSVKVSAEAEAADSSMMRSSRLGIVSLWCLASQELFSWGAIG